MLSVSENNIKAFSFMKRFWGLNQFESKLHQTLKAKPSNNWKYYLNKIKKSGKYTPKPNYSLEFYDFGLIQFQVPKIFLFRSYPKRILTKWQASAISTKCEIENRWTAHFLSDNFLTDNFLTAHFLTAQFLTAHFLTAHFMTAHFMTAI